MSRDPDLAELARQAYLYGFPLVFDLEQVQRYVRTGVGANPAAAYNTFSHARTLATPADRFVTINNDTVYSMAQVDLSAGPLVLEVPDTAGEYYVLQFVSAWTENFAYIGKRATGTQQGRFLLVPPQWAGRPTSGTPVVRFPTTVASIVGRWAVQGPDDLPRVHALQDATRLTPLAPTQGAVRGVPAVAQPPGEALAFWERYRTWSREFPPSGRDRGLQASFGVLGLTGPDPVAGVSDGVADALVEGFEAGRAFVARSLRGGHTPERNGWQLTLHVFDYNLDHFEIGTVDAPQWRIEDPQARLFIRAGAALGGLWGNHAYEAAYLTTYVDDHGEQLTGARTYQLTLDPAPPAGAFWSVTMYDVPHYFLVDNPLRRYSIGDRTPGTVAAPRGGLTITMSHHRPTDPDAVANWLPAPAGDFRPMLRVYMPGPAVLDGSYELPAIRRIA
jgi:hypothetical protein